MSAAPVVPVPRRELWGIRLHYLVYVGGGGFLFPFLVLFFRRSGLSGTEIGFISTAGGIATLLSAPLWGSWIDRSSNPRRLLQWSLLATALMVLWMSQQHTFFWLVVVQAAISFVGSGADPASTILVLGVTRGDLRSGFGSVRLWGSLGWAICVLAGGWLIERNGILTGFIAYAASLAVSTAVLSLVQVHRDSAPSAMTAITRRGSLLETARRLRSDRPMVALAAALVLVWLCTSGLHQFEILYMDQLGAQESLIGLSGTLVGLAELPLMLAADRLVRRFGPDRVLRVAMLADILKSLIVLIAPSIAVIMLSRVIGALSFSFYTVGVVMYVSRFVPEHQTATILALYTVTLHSLVNIAGAPLTGLAFDAFGAYWLYAIALTGVALAWFVLWRARDA